MRSRSNSRHRSRSRSSSSRRRRRRSRSRSRSRSRRRRSRSRSRSRRSRSPPASRRNLAFETPQQQRQFVGNSQTGNASTVIPTATPVTPEQISQVLSRMIAAATSPGSPGAALLPSRPSNENQQMLKGKLPDDLKFRFAICMHDTI